MRICANLIKIHETYHIVLDNVESPERGGEPAAAVVGLAPREANAAVDDGFAVGIAFGSPEQESEGGERHIICSTFWQSIHISRQDWKQDISGRPKKLTIENNCVC